MNTVQLPSRVIDVMAALKTQGYKMRFSQLGNGNICVEIFKNDRYQNSFYLQPDKGFDMHNGSYEEICNLLDPNFQKRNAAVLKYLEGIIEY
jgi:hypothetical protein